MLRDLIFFLKYFLPNCTRQIWKRYEKLTACDGVVSSNYIQLKMPFTTFLCPGSSLWQLLLLQALCVATEVLLIYLAVWMDLYRYIRTYKQRGTTLRIAYKIKKPQTHFYMYMYTLKVS